MKQVNPTPEREQDDPADPPNSSEHHFRTDHLMADLKGRSVRGGAITISAQAVKFILQMGSTMVLARLLTPGDFGLIAMVTAVTGFVAMFKDAGLSMATVQREHITHEQVSTLFWINVALSLAVMTVVAALAPAIGWFYGEPRLVPITLVLAATFIFGGLTVQHQALFRRQMRFTALAAVEIASMAAGIAVAVLMAWYGFAYWALVGMTAANASANCALVWTLSGWHPGPPRRRTDVRPMLGFGAFLSLSHFLAYIRRNADNVLIGFLWGSSSLGIYSKAYNLLMLPINQVNAPISSIVVPVLSRLQRVPTQYKRYYLKALLLLCSVGMPVMGFAIVEAEPVILILFGTQWSEAVPIFTALIPAALIGTMNCAGGWLYVSNGKGRKLLIVNLAMTPIVLAGMIIGQIWGLIGVAIGFSIAYVIAVSGMICHAVSGTAVSVLDVLKSCTPPAIASAIAACIVWNIDSGLGAVLELVLHGVVFCVMYVVCWIALPGGCFRIRELVSVVKSLAPHRLSCARPTT